VLGGQALRGGDGLLGLDREAVLLHVCADGSGLGEESKEI
jgi:hypothetical protein